MHEQAKKRGPGRPRKGSVKVHLDITLDPEVVKALDRATENRSAFIERVLRKALQQEEKE